ncbi:microcin C transport system substrate-binding protein [Poseidonocella pacifica]|uniref:Microcin C transport system substrate-binding protein n=1 Tax=Poseidonocella pacifica TaxID=871651 RepID=A0A1I0XM02_9RHOB|nr:extracellular solute-binding protein [Poseidonocella pacifica]SFB01218.1 microcin C transport system substrate-binding protein [Poseidonocella pacifica]
MIRILLACLLLASTATAQTATAQTATAQTGEAPGASAPITTAHGISAFGPLKYPADFPHFEYVNPDAPKGGEMSFRGVYASRTFDSLNPFILKGEYAQGVERLHDTLLARAFDEPDSYYGLIAESLEYPEDRAWVIFNLRPEARFSDGTPITAEDVVWTLDTLKTQGAPYYRITLDDIAGAEALSPSRVKVTFAQGAATRNLPADVGQIEILPKHYYADVPFDESTLVPPVSSGAFRARDIKPGRAITYCQDPDYWGADLPVNRGHLNFDCFRYEYFADTTAAFESFKVGEYLLHEEYSSALWATNYDFPAVERGSIILDEIPDGRSSGAQGFWFNLRRPHLQDIRVREAIGILFNFEWSNEALFYGAYQRSDSFWENSNLQAEGIPEGAELALLEQIPDLPARVLTAPAVVPRISRPVAADRGATREASDLLDAAGWEVGPDGQRRNAKGEPLRLDFVDDSPSFERIILPFIENLKRVGIDARLEIIDPAQMEERQKVFDYDMITARLVLPLTPSVEVRTVFGSQSANAEGTLNLTGIADPAVDALIDRVVSAATREDMTIATRALDRTLRAQHIWIPNWFKGTHWLAYWDVFGRPDIKPPFDRGVDTWWFDAERYESLREAGALR